MSYYIWLVVNVLFVIITAIYIWLFRTQDSSIILLGQFLAQIGILFFLVNVNMYFIFLVIRKSRTRKLKINLAKISRKMMKAHIPFAIMGTIIIIFHGIIMLYKMGDIVSFTNSKLLSGYAAILLLSVTLFAGYLRHKRSSGFRRRFHLVAALTFTSFFILHLFLPL
ncbi:hypothetical protein [Fredinandcohnia quinoae]|uniref:Uncharacterized protein n=1 Tax=Fredinandcohnia quinoae TaxID=2918902 RepID=A0AAW5DTL7_9BACI|nr:hypothetical protein [Fredinandcohnia sp. SECRCQ15]MCH1623986.1 hypothetical protein [Fredinandcohnia sp. SECRCQ15]